MQWDEDSLLLSQILFSLRNAPIDSLALSSTAVMSKSKGSREVMPEEPQHVLLEGKKDSVFHGETLVRELLEELLEDEAVDCEKALPLGSMKPVEFHPGPGNSRREVRKQNGKLFPSGDPLPAGNLGST